MNRLTAYVSGRVQMVGYRAKVVALAKEMGLVGLVKNLSDGRVLVIAEGEKDDLENLASALNMKNVLIDVENVEFQYTGASESYSNFRKVTGSDEIGDRLDEGVECLKELVVSVKDIAIGVSNLTEITKSGFENLGGKMDKMLDKQDQTLDKQDQMLDKQDVTIGEIQGMRYDLKDYMNQRFERIEGELDEIKTALKEKGII